MPATRTTTERVDHAFDLSLLGEDVDRLLEILTPEERDMFWELAQEVREGRHDAVNNLWRIDYEKLPPTITEFIEDDYYLGNTLRPSEDGKGLFPAWQHVLKRDFDLDSRVHNVVLTGSLGGGKSYAACVMLLYRITLTRLLRNPQAFYSLARGSEIYFVMLSISRKVVEETTFGEAKNQMSYSPFFREVCRFDPDRKYADQHISLGKDILLTAGSKGWHIIGRNAMGAFLDEGNFRIEANPDERAYKLYDEIRTRIKNRFMRGGTFLPSISLLASSARDESSFTERIVSEIEATPNDPTQKIYRFASYEVHPDIIAKLSNRYFRVEHGIRTSEPRVLEGVYQRTGSQDQRTYHELEGPFEAPNAGAQIAWIPLDFKDAFVRNVRTALQNVAGISTGGNFRLFSSTVDLEVCVAKGEEAGLVDPCTVPTISLSDEDTKQVWDYLDLHKILMRESSRLVPKRDAMSPRFIHVDLAKREFGGIAVCHVCGQQEVKGRIDSMGGVISVGNRYDLVVEYDFIISITSGKVKPIAIAKVLTFLVWLRDYAHYPVGIITADQYQSLLALELLERAHFKVAHLSVDREKKPYYDLRAAVEEHRIRWFRHPRGLYELEQLVDTQKVDHPLNGCFTGETRVALADGTRPSFRELALQAEPFFVYAIGPEGLCIAQARNARVTKRATALVEVMLDNYQVIRCTPDHLFMTLNREWIQAQHLTPDVRLMPLYRSMPRARHPKQRNHRVLEVRFVTADEEVYDLTVPGLENFALACGVFVHNSKDVADAICGSYTNAMTLAPSGGQQAGTLPSVYTNLDRGELEQPPLIGDLYDPRDYMRKPKTFEG